MNRRPQKTFAECWAYWIAKGRKPKSVLPLLLSHKTKTIDVDWPEYYWITSFYAN